MIDVVINDELLGERRVTYRVFEPAQYTDDC